MAQLSTGAANRRALDLYGPLDLYRSEGFEVVDVRVCWVGPLRTDAGLTAQTLRYLTQ